MEQQIIFAVKHASGKYLLLINPDIVVQEGCIEKLSTFIESNYDVGVVAPALYRPSGEFDYYNSFFPSMYSIFMIQLSLYNAARGMKRRTFAFFDENTYRGTPFQVEQAMAYVLPILASRIPALEEIVNDGVEGFLIESKKSVQIAKVLNTLLNNGNLLVKFSQNERFNNNS